MSQKSRKMKFKDKYFVSVIGKFQFLIPSGNTGFLSLQKIDGSTQFLRVRFSLASCVCYKYHAVVSSAACLYC
jgi:hypothetical protein